MSVVGPIILAAATLALGVLCVWWPEKVQTFAIRASSTGITGRSASLTRFVRSRQYLNNVRLVGVIALLISLFISRMMLK